MSVTRLRAKIDIRREPTGLIFPVGCTFDDWRDEAASLQRDHKSFLWLLGDAFLFGADKFGELYAEVIEPYSVETIQMAMRVCRAIPLHRRRDIGFSFHQAVVALPAAEQDELLERAERESWTREAMRQELRERRAAAAAVDVTPCLPLSAEDPAEPPRAEPDEPPIDDVVEPPPPAEPAPSSPARDLVVASSAWRRPDDPMMPADDAAAMLAQMVEEFALPEAVALPVRSVLDERARLLALVRSLRIAIELGIQTTPGLRNALRALDGEPAEAA